jgi:hypothetical protein
MKHDIIPMSPLPIPEGDLFGGIIKAITDYASIVEQGKTERQEILAKRDVALEIIQSERALLTQYLTMRFGEKAAMYTGYFNLLSMSLENQDTGTIRLLLENILEVYKDDPCRTGIFRKIGPNSAGTIQI